MLAAGLGRLHLTPAVFWSLSLAEWHAIASSRRRAYLDRAVLEALMQQFPD